MIYKNIPETDQDIQDKKKKRIFKNIQEQDQDVQENSRTR